MSEATVSDSMEWITPPFPSSMVTLTVYTPSAAYVCITVAPVPFAPSPNVQVYASVSLFASEAGAVSVSG